jgi:hypothetical protein
MYSLGLAPPSLTLTPSAGLLSTGVARATGLPAVPVVPVVTPAPTAAPAGFFNTAITWVKDHPLLAAGGAVAVWFVLRG